MGFYRFPPYQAEEKISEIAQVAYINGELMEAIEALFYTMVLDLSRESGRDNASLHCLFAYGMELMDVIHATETALRLSFTDEEVELIREAIIEKNRERGYYREGER